MKASEIYQVLLTCPVVYLQVSSALMNYRQVNVGFRAFCLFPKYACLKYFIIKKKKKDRVFPHAHSDILHFGVRWGLEDRMRPRSTFFFFFPMGFFCFTASNFGRLYCSVWALLEERSERIRSVLTGIDFCTEGSQCLDLILLQLFPLFGNCCVFCLIWGAQEH